MRTAPSNAPFARRTRCASALLWVASALVAAGSFAAPDTPAPDTRKKQEILFPEVQTRTVEDPPFTVAVRASSGLPVTLELVAGPAVLDKKNLRLTGEPGLVILKATQAGDDAFQPAPTLERAFTVLPRPTAPVFVGQPEGAYAQVGDTLSLAVRVEGEPKPELQWRRDGIPVVGANGPTLLIPSAALSNSGTYDVLASNAKGRVASARARVTVVRRRQMITFQAPQTFVPGQGVSLQASSSSGLPVHLEVVSGSATLNGDVLYPTSATVIVQATQPGDSLFDAAQPVSQTLVASAVPVTRYP